MSIDLLSGSYDSNYPPENVLEQRQDQTLQNPLFNSGIYRKPYSRSYYD